VIPAEYRWQAIIFALVALLVVAQLVFDALHGWPL
jgi:hypothetical protein